MTNDEYIRTYAQYVHTHAHITYVIRFRKSWLMVKLVNSDFSAKLWSTDHNEWSKPTLKSLAHIGSEKSLVKLGVPKNEFFHFSSHFLLYWKVFFFTLSHGFLKRIAYIKEYIVLRYIVLDQRSMQSTLICWMVLHCIESCRIREMCFWLYFSYCEQIELKFGYDIEGVCSNTLWFFQNFSFSTSPIIELNPITTTWQEW